MINYAKAIVTGAILVAGNMAYAAEPVALNALDLDMVSAGTAPSVISTTFQSGHSGNAINAIAFGGPLASAGGRSSQLCNQRIICVCGFSSLRRTPSPLSRGVS